MDRKTCASKIVTEKILKEDHGQNRQGLAGQHQEGTLSKVRERNDISHQSFHPVMRKNTTQNSRGQGDNANGAQKAAATTLVERWQNETFGQAPWNNISAVEATKEAIQPLEQAGEERERGQAADSWSTMAVDGSDDESF